MKVHEEILKHNQNRAFIVNKQFDNKTYCVVTVGPFGSESVIAYGFKTIKQANTWAAKQDFVGSITGHRPPTPGEIKFGHGATHYKDFTISQMLKKDGGFKARVKCPIDGLVYSLK